jgi:hypothetical protein
MQNRIKNLWCGAAIVTAMLLANGASAQLYSQLQQCHDESMSCGDELWTPTGIHFSGEPWRAFIDFTESWTSSTCEIEFVGIYSSGTLDYEGTTLIGEDPEAILDCATIEIDDPQCPGCWSSIACRMFDPYNNDVPMQLDTDPEFSIDFRVRESLPNISAGVFITHSNWNQWMRGPTGVCEVWVTGDWILASDLYGVVHVPEPGVGSGLLAGSGVLIALARRRLR